FSIFFFSSRRRHTRWPRDWSSDVCSSDLGELAQALQDQHYKALALHSDLSQYQRDSAVHSFRIGLTNLLVATEVAARGLDIPKRSEERRVGKECRREVGRDG